MSKIIIPKPSASELALVSLIAGEHLLIEDIPGTGKTYLANNLSKLSKLKSNRIQCTNDLMPADVIGYNKSTKNLATHQAKLAKKANLDALVCSVHEIKYVRKFFKKEIITPPYTTNN